MIFTTFLSVLYLLSLSESHFVVNIPPPLGSNIENEDVAPCGGFTPSASDNITNFHVDGDAIGVSSLHAQAFFAYRGQLGTTLTNPNWTLLIPTVQEYGLNMFCEPSIAVPSTWAGQTGLLQIIQDAEDGTHYQCMHVNFVAGVATPSSACSNSSGVSANFADDPIIDGIIGIKSNSSSTTAPSSMSSGPSSTSSVSASPSASKSAAEPVAKIENAKRSLFIALAVIVCLV